MIKKVKTPKRIESWEIDAIMQKQEEIINKVNELERAVQHLYAVHPVGEKE